MRWAGHVACIGERTGACMVMVGRFGVKRPLRKTRIRWQDNIKMDLQEVGRWTRIGLNWLRIGTNGGHL
jgi:hypothetical protein